MKILFVIGSLGPGGAERVISILANQWAQKNWEITIATLQAASEVHYDLNPRIHHLPLGLKIGKKKLKRSIKDVIKIILALRKALRENKPHVVISFIDEANIVTLLASRGLRIPILISDRNNPRFYPERRVSRWLRWMTYPFAKRLIVQTERVKSLYPAAIQKKIAVIPNPVPSPAGTAEIHNDIEISNPSVVGVGRFTHEKGFDLLIQAFNIIARNHPEWTLTILGDGVLRNHLEALRDKLGLHARVFLPGRTRSTAGIFKKTDIFVLPSRNEGFPNVLCEAMACGVAVIAADCDFGPREIIRHGKDGILIPAENVNEMANAMEMLITDTQGRKSLSECAKEVTTRFSLERVLDLWEEEIHTFSAPTP